MSDNCLGLLLTEITGIYFHNTTSAHLPDGYDLSFEGGSGFGELYRILINKGCCLKIVKHGEYCDSLLNDAPFQQVIKKLLYG